MADKKSFKLTEDDELAGAIALSLIELEEKDCELAFVHEARMTEIKAKLDELEANKPPTLDGKRPTPEWLKQSKDHAANRGAYEATLSEDEMNACQARGWYVFSHLRRPGNKKNKKDKKNKKKEKEKKGSSEQKSISSSSSPINSWYQQICQIENISSLKEL